MATNDWQIETDDYDLFGAQGVTEALPGTPTIDGNGHLVIPDEPYFSPSTLQNSTMDKDPNNTGPTTGFWDYYPLTIDIDGFIYYYNENTGINVRGPAGATHVSWDDLTPEQKASLKGQDGTNGRDGANGQDGADGRNGYSAYELWLIDNGWQDDPEDHPLSDFYAYLANLSSNIVQEGTGNGSLILNYRNQAGSIASGEGSTALGYHTTASGSNSIATGNYTVAGYPNQLVIGKYNANQPGSLFEIGNGLDDNTRSNVFTIDTLGNVTTTGDIVDGYGNTLYNKVDKVAGKQLSTYDFDSTYKDMLDSYYVETTVNPLSTNPVSSSAVYTAIQSATSAISRPTQASSSADEDLCFFHPASVSSGTLDAAKFTTNLTWNPNKKTLKTTNIGVTHTGNFAFGNNLLSGANNQILFGQYNEGKENTIIEIGGGYSNESRQNLLELNANGDITAYGDVIDGGGNTLSSKQDKLTFDQTITQYSSNMVTSGVIYDYLTSHGIDPVSGISVPEVDYLETLVNQLTVLVNQLQAQVTAIGDPRIITDDLYNDHTYTYGIYDGEFYIRRTDDDDDEEEEEEDPEV